MPKCHFVKWQFTNFKVMLSYPRGLVTLVNQNIIIIIQYEGDVGKSVTDNNV